MIQHKEGDDYGAILAETVSPQGTAIACYEEAVEHSRNLHGKNHPEYATGVHNHACLFFDLKQYEAIPRLEEALAIEQRVFGAQHDQSGVAQIRSCAIDVGHNFRMCSWCGAVSEAINTCPCVRAWYLNADCQLQHWPTHKPHCSVCYPCSTVRIKVLDCSRCKQAKYCNAACQTAHWSLHKKECVAPMMSKK
jgi:hypothetical protein